MRVLTFYDLGGNARVRVETQSALRFEFLKDFYFSVNGYQSHDSDSAGGERQGRLRGECVARLELLTQAPAPSGRWAVWGRWCRVADIALARPRSCRRPSPTLP